MDEAKDFPTGNSNGATAPAMVNDTTSPAGNDESDGVQIRCYLDSEVGMFRVLESRGKALSSGGFGVSIPHKSDGDGDGDAATITGADLDETVTEEVNGVINQDQKQNSAKIAKEYLFVEEVLFLHERGLLECLASPPTNNIIDETGADQSINYMDTAELFRLLPRLSMSLPMYLVYQHLRSQDFRILRHNPKRLALLKGQQELRSIPREQRKNMQYNQQVTDLRHQVRSSVAKALPPAIAQSEGSLTIAWDAYLPNAQFAKTHPGLPDFYVAVTYYNESHLRFAQMEELVVNHCHGIPLKLATVSDSGTVVMFGVSNMGVPRMTAGNEG